MQASLPYHVSQKGGRQDFCFTHECTYIRVPRPELAPNRYPMLRLRLRSGPAGCTDAARDSQPRGIFRTRLDSPAAKDNSIRSVP